MALIKQDQYDLLVKAFRDRPGVISHAARFAGVTRNTAAKAWERGLGRPLFARLSIKQVLEQERAEARAARAAQERELQRQEAERRIVEREESIKSFNEELSGVKQGRKIAVNFSVVAGKCVVHANAVAEEIGNRIAGGVQQMALNELRSIMSTLGLIVLRSQQTLRYALELERVRSGKPIEILGTPVERMTPAQLVEQLAGLNRTFERAQGISDADDLDRDTDEQGTPDQTTH
jgi:hypothetical protein